ncbi:MAG: ABC transporter permease [Synergistaceae bacterium]|jgi:ribose transport system permease protein|nr:ABC transporter permease [Synergistaceae bacterium]
MVRDDNRDFEARSQSIAAQFREKVKREALREKLRVYTPILLLFALSLIFSVYDRRFFSAANINNLLYQMAIPLILATGITFVLLLGSIDLSLEGIMGLSGSSIALLIQNTKNANDFGALGVAAPIAGCALLGALTGYIHAKTRIASFVATFAMGSIATGLAVLTYRGVPAVLKAQWVVGLSVGSFLRIPYLTWIAFGIFGAGCVLLHQTAFGVAVYAIGDNEPAARASGSKVDAVKISAFAICACTAGIAGFVSCVRLKIGQVAIGTDQLFPAITALVLGGVALTGGKGGMLQTFVGVLIYTELQNFLTIVGVDAYYKNAVQGIIIIVAVALTVPRSRKTISK